VMITGSKTIQMAPCADYRSSHQSSGSCQDERSRYGRRRGHTHAADRAATHNFPFRP